MRVANWSSKLAESIQVAQARAFEWGQWDCCQFAASMVSALTGRDPREIFPPYASESDALRIIAEFGGMEALITRALGRPKPPSFAQRGDIVLCEFGRGQQPAVCVGVWCVAPGNMGLEKRMTDTAIVAWTV